ncbi:hypothetical protein HAX54_050329 [Datura stramonium]|uniref:Uncharacterized protein n=1 Tax=Datura stramonium TaxID=4076 RepID=A0ABS8SWA5_DATST|nr:hypothetical protein [Datura stramonium]
MEKEGSTAVASRRNNGGDGFGGVAVFSMAGERSWRPGVVYRKRWRRCSSGGGRHRTVAQWIRWREKESGGATLLNEEGDEGGK